MQRYPDDTRRAPAKLPAQPNGMTESKPPKEVQDLSSMSIDELWGLHEEIAATLVAKITAEKEVIDDRLRLLNQVPSDANENHCAD